MAKGLSKDDIKKISSSFAAAKRYWEPVWDRRLEDYRWYTGLIPKKKYESEANFHVPYVATLVDNVHPLLTSRIPMGKPKARNSEEGRQAERLMKELLKYTYDVNKWPMLYSLSVKESMLMDTAWLKVTWEYQDENTDHPKIQLLNSFDVYPHPRKTDLDDHWAIYIRSELTKDQMLDYGWDKKAIDGLGKTKLEFDDFRKKQLELLGLSTDEISKMSEEKEGVYEVIEVWEKRDFDGEKKMACVVIANEDTVLNTEPMVSGREVFESPYDHGMAPLIAIPYNAIPHQILGEGFIRPVSQLQNELNALENMNIENYLRRNNPPIKVRRGSKIDVRKLRFYHSVPWLVTDMDDLQYMEIPDLAPSIIRQQDKIRAVMQARTGANDILLVTDDSRVQGGDTATGASIANENTKLRFRPQSLINDMALVRLGTMLISMYQQPEFFDREKAIEIAGEEGKVEMIKISPNDIRGDLTYIIEVSSEVTEPDAVRLQKLVNMKGLYGERQDLDQDVLDREIFDLAGIDWETIQVGKEGMANELGLKLQQLTALAKKPGFENQSPEKKQMVLSAIQKITMMLGGQDVGQGEVLQGNASVSAGGQQMMGTPVGDQNGGINVGY